MRKRNLFERVGYTKQDFNVTALILGVVVATSSDADTRLKCDRALKHLRKLKRAVYTERSRPCQKPNRKRGKRRK